MTRSNSLAGLSLILSARLILSQQKAMSLLKTSLMIGTSTLRKERVNRQLLKKQRDVDLLRKRRLQQNISVCLMNKLPPKQKGSVKKRLLQKLKDSVRQRRQNVSVRRKKQLLLPRQSVSAKQKRLQLLLKQNVFASCKKLQTLLRRSVLDLSRKLLLRPNVSV